MVSAQVTIHTPHGLHLRPAGELAEEALKYRCRVSLAHGDKEISAKSLLGILSLCIRQDTEITVVCDGMDEQKARVFAAQSVLGAARMVLESSESVEQLRINVCSPNGTTIEAVDRLFANGFMDDVKEGFQAVDRSIEMGKEE